MRRWDGWRGVVGNGPLASTMDSGVQCVGSTSYHRQLWYELIGCTAVWNGEGMDINDEWLDRWNEL